MHHHEHNEEGATREELEQIYGSLREKTPEELARDKEFDPYEPMSFEQIRDLDTKYILGTYARMPVAFVYGTAEFLFDTTGKEYIDFLSGIAVTSLGHANPDLVEALRSQADRLWHVSNIFYNQPSVMLARALVEITFPGKIFFANSGTEANEAALKLMRAYGQAHTKEKTKIISLKGSFHGRTFGAMSLTGQEKIHGGFGPLVSDIEFVLADDTASIVLAIDENTAGVILEPIQGEGGVLPLDEEFIATVRERCNEEEALLAFDEIQTGVGRTGHYFAYQAYKTEPDILTMAKGLGGGFPIGAMLVKDKYADVFTAGMHGSTFGGNPLATAVGYEVLRTIESQGLLEHAREMGDYLYAGLEELRAEFPDLIEEIRGLGLLVGVVLKNSREARPLVEKALTHGLIIGRAGDNVIRLAPPLVVRESSIDAAIEKLRKLFKELK